MSRPSSSVTAWRTEVSGVGGYVQAAWRAVCIASGAITFAQSNSRREVVPDPAAGRAAFALLAVPAARREAPWLPPLAACDSRHPNSGRERTLFKADVITPVFPKHPGFHDYPRIREELRTSA